MTTSELKKIISNSANTEWFNTQVATFNFQYINFTKTFIGVSGIYEFVGQQFNGWNKLAVNLPAEFASSMSYFQEIQSQVIQLGSNSNQHFNYLDQVWNQISNRINNVQFFPFLYDVSETDFLINIYKNSPINYQGAYQFITGRFNQSINDKNYFTGLILAYEFTLKDCSQIVERRNSEKSSISKIRSDFKNYLTESETQLSAHLKNANTNYHDHITELENIKQTKEKTFDDWFANSNTELVEFNKLANKKIDDLAKSYEELLRLKKPAEYWKLRAADLKNQAWKSLYWLIGSVLFASIILFSLLWLTPEDMLATFYSGDKSRAVRWSIIFITLISFLFLGIRALTRVTFSSFHLARDAEERESLTYVYLALIKDSSIDKDDRQLVMQSLFSRADTGLLKDDASPTMPGVGSVVEKMLQHR